MLGELCNSHLMTQEIITIDPEADVRIGGEAVDSVKGKFTESNLGRIKGKMSTWPHIHCYWNSYSDSLISLIFHVLTLSSVGSAQSAN